MTSDTRILLLAGSAEARQIAVALLERGLHVRALMSEAPRGANPMPVDFEVCGEPSQEVLASAMATKDAVIDASHGFDGAMTDAGWKAARAADLPFVTLRRPGWDVAAHDLWTAVTDVAAAMELIPPGARVFSAAGWASLPDCAAFQGSRLLLRQTTPHNRPVPFDFVQPVFGTPPFTVESETDLFRRLQIDMLMCRNLGGAPSRPKVDAAVALGLPVLLIERPAPPPEAHCVDHVNAVLAWVAAL
ncbi:Precorrin-6A reductase [Sulfitobacter noctilucicola]|uniref:Precorrin-6A/cobalt-precorrin-6A reductase n=1 Tax=Sulfitobacter noctilucicola TaxID=1342301 RepID=A0A7W6Q3C8_9RHOB|nr:precorrin-6A/cobalt-precorrin-6A reductase [Sulfitobacter noctilucicola]KIN64804.1 Precorrin-6A reductase [Sulfitobacter noctilucicola]MBB4174050.1 precorrin-6A/cobalt-precorrin-6A reductase [Sulfitobacter noctilucicola]